LRRRMDGGHRLPPPRHARPIDAQQDGERVTSTVLQQYIA
jgi:hypothetical protein